MNTVLKVTLSVKFRAFAITFANWTENFTIPLNVTLKFLTGTTPINFSRNGVTLTMQAVEQPVTPAQEA